jgi:hypothetical protein
MASKQTPIAAAKKTITVKSDAPKASTIYMDGAHAAVTLAAAMDARKHSRAEVEKARKALEALRPALEAKGVKFDVDTIQDVRKRTQATIYMIHGIEQGKMDRTEPLARGTGWVSLLDAIFKAVHPTATAATVTGWKDGDKAVRDTAMKAVKRAVTAMSPIKVGVKTKKTASEMAEDAANRIVKDAANFNPRQTAKIIQAFTDALKAAAAKPAKEAAPP